MKKYSCKCRSRSQRNTVASNSLVLYHIYFVKRNLTNSETYIDNDNSNKNLSNLFLIYNGS